MAQWAKMLATKSGYPNSSPEIHMVEIETGTHKLSSPLHVCTAA